MGYISKQRILNRRISNDQKTLKEMLNILSQQGNANQNNSEVPSYQSEWLRSKTPMIAYAGGDVDRVRGKSLHCWWEYKLVQPL